ncbi:MAG TPA: 3-deoxy-7-phosphoheptulonate synthase [Opitutaceae bacterium]
MERTSDINVVETRVLPPPEALLRDLPKSEAQSEFVIRARREIEAVIHGRDPRLLCIVGPCSIHDTDAALEYARKLAQLSRDVSDRLVIAMRVYFEKPRTTVGWKGMIMDPGLDGSNDIGRGLRMARQLLGDVLDLGLPTATELLDPITPQYIADLVCWSAIGARTVESQIHRQMASGLSMPLGFKNSTDGSIASAVNAIKSAAGGHTFLGITLRGEAAIVSTRGNRDCHVVLRGGASGPNMDAASVASARRQLEAAGIRPAVLVDCSHDNSGKNPDRQPAVLECVLDQVKAGDRSIVGFMLESNLLGGNQPLTPHGAGLRRGVSITDGCIDWETTERCIRAAHAVAPGRSNTNVP